ncbi:hypothetical protein [Nocardia nova]|uniref:hypothetical protein n=1 Tax=Nocardia nova TaxID=37330 RepID=UPI001CA56405|nr:hypothetical protein [Nocardia nova]
MSSESTQAMALIDIGTDPSGHLVFQPAVPEIIELHRWTDLGRQGNIRLIDDPNTVWSWQFRRRRAITLMEAHLPSQLIYLRAGIHATERVAAQMANHPGLPRDGKTAVVTALALLLSAQVPGVSTFSTWEWRRCRPVPGNRSIGWISSGVFFEAGARTLQQWWRERTSELRRALEYNGEILKHPANVILGDAADTGLQKASADAVLWDPGHYDNIDYPMMARPHEIVLTSLAHLFDSTEMRVTRALKHDFARASFDGELYEQHLRSQANEAKRLLRPGSHVGVLWDAHDPSGLQHFLDLIAPTGLKLTQAFRITDRGCVQ